MTGSSYAEASPRGAVLDIGAVRQPIQSRVDSARRSFRAIYDTERARRVINVAIALFGLIVTAPVMLLVAAVVKLTSRGPVFYTQTRVGIDRRTEGEPAGNHRRHVDYGGRPFRIYKFRTMTASQQSAGQVWAAQDDPRITRVGGFLRKYRLDELPQLVNVLRGDMNIVGPRPEQPDILMQLRDQVSDYQRRQRVLPGITGWAQVNHHYDQSIDDVRRKVQLDLEYIHRRSAVEDMRIMLQTVPVMLFRKGGW